MKFKIFVLAAFAVLIATGCRKEPTRQLNDEESRIYITNKNSSIRFGTFTTFAIRDSILNVDGDNSSYQLNNVDRAFIAAFRNSMIARGYVAVDRNQSPDLGIQITRITRTSTGSIIWGGWWGGGGWGGWWGPGWGWGGMPGWGGVSTFQVREGMLSFDLLDLDKAQIDSKIDIIWNGLIRGRGIFDVNTAQAQVNQLFEQSPYLKKD